MPHLMGIEEKGRVQDLVPRVRRQQTELPAPPGEEPRPRRYDLFTLDGLLSTPGQLFAAAGAALRGAQTGRLRGYVLVLALTVVVMLAMLLGLG